MKAHITTAVELTKSQLTSLTKQLKAKYGSDLEVNTEVKPEVLGGISVTIGSTQLNGTIKHKLATIKQELTQA